MKFTLDIQSSEQLANICGVFDKNLDYIASNLNINVSNKGSDFKIKGENTPLAVSVLQDLLTLSESKAIDFGDVDLCIQSLNNPNGTTKSVTIKTSRKHINIRSTNQQKYVNAIIENDAVFAIGPAGTGKTYLAVARAVEALESSNIKRIVLVRPAVEAGEKLGFLPGDLSEKVDPYLRPIYDALYEFIGFERVNRLIEKQVIEVAPLAFMRGRTLNEAYIILDEAQNTTIPQMKMFLTRMGFGSKMVITGDITQIDLPVPNQSGLIDAIKILHNIENIAFCNFDAHDVVRHQLVKKIVSAYDQS
ncbi:MAG: PhoH family protein [Candidatus Thioglobus sp.]|jgi:phosphate starvation-inducible PhoH-like protein|nr:phosphate starvation-inducible protein PhoH [Thiotrichales bacterium]MCS5589868.1 PhoH family protein [Candidatus Thioglobus sp.]